MIKTKGAVIHKANWKTDEHTLKQIRKTVFIDEQNVPAELEWDGLDPDCRHFVAYVDNQAVATARIKPDGHIGRMAVLQEHRNTGIGSELLSAIIQDATDLGLQRVYLHAQISACGFYRKHGFIAEGEEFMDAGIVHRAMVKNLC